MDSLASAASGINAAFSRAEAAAGQVASPDADLTQSMVSLTESSAAVKANAAVIRSIDQTLGHVLDVLR